MAENFNSISEDRKKIILNACIEEFAEKGYERASTNNIVKKAGIPKGTLFYFFGSKKALYLYILEYAVAIFVKKFEAQSADLSSDIFDRLLQRGLQKLKMGRDEPLLYQIVFSAFMNAPEKLKAEINEKFAGLRENASTLFDNIDTSGFRENINLEKAVEIISTLLEGVINKYLSLFKNCKPGEALGIYDKLQTEVRHYFEILKYGIYKSGQ